MNTYGQLMEAIRAFHENSTVVFHTNREGSISSDDSVGSASGVSDQVLSNMGHSGLRGKRRRSVCIPKMETCDLARGCKYLHTH